MHSYNGHDYPGPEAKSRCPEQDVKRIKYSLAFYSGHLLLAFNHLDITGKAVN